MRNLKRCVILILTVCILANILILRIIDIRFEQKCPLPPNTIEVSAEEADTFFKYWADYVNRGYNHRVPEDLRYDDQKISKRLPWIVHLWFQKRCISVERFYYVEQRMRNILKAKNLKDQTNSVIKVLRSEMKEGVPSEKKKWYENVIVEQQNMADVEGITEAELKLIEGQEEAIQKVLE